MVVVPLTRGEYVSSESRFETPEDRAESTKAESTNWIRYAAAGTLAASGALLVTGHRRIGLVTALSGAALALIDQQDVVRKCWDRLPEFLEDLQGLLSKTQSAVEDFSSQSEKLRQVLSK
jgi:hypothetical protein